MCRITFVTHIATTVVVVKEGDLIDVKVIDMDPDARKVALSVKAAVQGDDFDYRETMKTLEQEGRVSFGDVLAGKLGGKPED